MPTFGLFLDASRGVAFCPSVHASEIKVASAAMTVATIALQGHRQRRMQAQLVQRMQCRVSTGPMCPTSKAPEQVHPEMLERLSAHDNQHQEGGHRPQDDGENE